MRNTQYAIRYAIFQTKWGYFGLTGTETSLLRTHLPLPDYERLKARLLKNLPQARFEKTFFKTLQQQITAYFEGDYVDFSLDFPLMLDGFSKFTRSVLTACRGIRFGQTISYGQLAQKTGCLRAARAVGNALAKNPLPLIIPCHRVICSDGKIGGFSSPGGITLKKRLLRLEQKSHSPT